MRAQQRRRLERPREQVLAAAMAAIAEHGLARLTMAGLAKRLDTSGGHILYYFGSKDQLLLETLAWSEAQLAGDCRAARESSPDARTALARFVEGYLPTGPGDPRWMLWLEVWTRAVGDPEIREGQAALDAVWRDELVAVLGAGLASGEFRPLDPAAHATRFMALLDGLSSQIVMGTLTRPDVLEHAADYIDTVITAGP